MEPPEPPGRMIDPIDLDHLRHTSRHPSWWDRFGQRLSSLLLNKTAVTVILALTIVVVLAIGYWATT